jgi:hypothetical protein
VLTQELVRGWSWNDALTCDRELRDSWAEAIYRFVYGSNQRFGLVNADSHPGNYLFHDDGSVSFLDFGCVKRFTREQREMMNAIARACLHEDALGTWRASVECGFWRSCDPVTPEEAFAYWREPWELWWAPQPFTITPEYVSRWRQRRFGLSGPSANACRYITAPPDYAMGGRIEISAASLAGELHATNHWRALVREFLEGAAPLTAMGKLEHAFFAERKATSSHA